MLRWQQHSRCHSVSFVMYIAGAKFEENCFKVIPLKLFYYQTFFETWPD